MASIFDWQCSLFGNSMKALEEQVIMNSFTQLIKFMLRAIFLMTGKNVRQAKLATTFPSTHPVFYCPHFLVKGQRKLHAMDVSIGSTFQCAHRQALLRELGSAHPALRDVTNKVLRLPIVARGARVDHGQVVVDGHLVEKPSSTVVIHRTDEDIKG